ncbi:MAG: PIG-L deacetylase family protein [Ardenticatenaceae bacterium]
MCILAHPDDESLGTGSALAKYAAEGVETYVITATRGERGWSGEPQAYPGPDELGRIREAELRAAAAILGVRHVEFLDYIDGELDQANPGEAISRIVDPLRRIRPQVVITFGPDGAYGHPDHIAISQFTTGAIVCAADPSYPAATGAPPHRVSKLYYIADTHELLSTLELLDGELAMTVDGVERRPVPWEDWAITTRITAAAHWDTVSQAIACHETQLAQYAVLKELPDDIHRRIWSTQTLYRVFSLVNGGRRVEEDLFEGLR